METSERNLKKKNTKGLFKQNHFKIRMRKSFLAKNRENIPESSKRKRSIDYKSYQFSKFYNNRKKSFSQNKRKNSIFLSLTDYKNIEDDIKNALLVMRRACLYELRRQSCEPLMIESIKDIKKNESEKKVNNLNIKFSSMHSHNSNSNKIMEKNINKKLIKSKSFDIKKNEEINEIILNNKSYDQKNLNNEIKFNSLNDSNNINYKTQSQLNNKNNLTNIYKNRNKDLKKERFRFLSHGCLVLDSNEENESDEDNDISGFIINPETKAFFIYDIILTFSVFYTLIYTPFELADSFCLCNIFKNNINNFINIFIDILFFLDLIINFFLQFYTKEEEKLVKNNKKIIKNYIFGWFLLDFFSCIPINIFSMFYCKTNSIQICLTYEKDNKINFLLLLRCLKSIKIFKISTRKKNQFITKIFEKCSNFVLFENILDILTKILNILFGLHIITCINIFIGRHTYPGWIYKNKYQDYSLSNLYMISIYYIITTLTTVGYGDVQSDSMIEILFRLILLAFGIVEYTWIVSSISNGINKESFASINYLNELNILENIRITHTNLPYSLYLNIMNHLKQKHFYQKKYDKNLLINSLPYGLKNDFIFSMYKNPIEKFDYFKNILNSNFIAETLSYFSPITANKNDILLKENDILEEMFYVIEGKLALEVSININNPEESINKYLSYEFLTSSFEFENNLNHSHLQRISKPNTFFAGGMANKKEEKNFINNVYLKIHDIHKNEDYGDIFMFFGKRSPFAVRVKTKRIKLFIIKKDDFAKLCGQYNNILSSIHKKKKHNLMMIKNILIKTIDKFCSIKGIKIQEKFKDTIKKATNELNKGIVPIEILKNKKSESSLINEIDEEINQTIKDFDIEVSKLQSNLNSREKRKIFGNIKKVKSSTILKTKNIFLEDLNLSSGNESIYYYSSLLRSHKKKIHQKNSKKIRTNIKSNSSLKTNIKEFNANPTESDLSLKTVEMNNTEIESSPSAPKTIKSLPKSLLNSIKIKIKYHKFLNKKDSNFRDDFKFISKNDNSNNNSNEILNHKNSNSNNTKINLIENINTSNVNINVNKNNTTFFSFNKKENSNKSIGEISPISKKILINSKNKKSNISNISLLKMKKKSSSNISKFSQINNFKNYEKEKEYLKKNNRFDSKNLSLTSTESFELKRRYKNINEVSGGAYIKDKYFQMNTIKFIKNYYERKDKIKNTDKIRNNKLASNSQKMKFLYENENNNFFEFRKSSKSIEEKTNISILKNEKLNKNQMKKINHTYIKENSLSSLKLKNRSTRKDLSINSINDNNNNSNKNTNYFNVDSLTKLKVNNVSGNVGLYNDVNKKLTNNIS